LEKVCIDNKDKHAKLAQEISNIREMNMEIISIIVSSLGAVHARSFEALRNLLLSNDKKTEKIGRRLSEAAIMGWMEIWRRYARDMPCTEDTRAVRMTTQEVMIANDKEANEHIEEDQEDQESGSEQAKTTDERTEDQRIVDLTNEIDTESI
jgi:hypothetical protein